MLNHSKNCRGLDDIASRHRIVPAQKRKNNVTAAHKHHFHWDASQFSRRKNDARNEMSSITNAIYASRYLHGRMLEFPRGNRDLVADNDDRAG